MMDFQRCQRMGLMVPRKIKSKSTQGTVRLLIQSPQALNPCAGLSGSVGCVSDWRPGGRGFDPRRGRQHSFLEIDHEIFSTTVILSLPLIQEG